MSFRSRAVNTLIKGFRANSRVAARRLGASFNSYAFAPSSNVAAMLFSTASDASEKKEGLSPEEAKKMASEMLFNEKDDGEKKEEKKDKKYLRREFSYSKFQQTILLPENVEKDKISAKVEHGILSIEIPKVKEEEKQKTSKAIEVK